MSAVKEVVDELNLDIPIAGLAKDGKHRTSELLYGFPPQTIGLKQNSPLFRLLTQIQDEVHRFAITFHRDKRSKRQVASALDEIKGIGEKTKNALLKEFKSVKRIKEASAEDIVKVIGEAKAKIIKDYFIRQIVLQYKFLSHTAAITNLFVTLQPAKLFFRTKT